MSKKKHTLSDADKKLWESVKKTVRPLNKNNQQPPSPVPLPRIEIKSTPLPDSWFTGAGLTPERTIHKKVKRQLSKGLRPVDRSLDLHGMTQEKAYTVLVRTVHACIKNGDRTLIVVTGKGGKRFVQTGQSAAYRTRADFDQFGGVLKRMVPLWLESEDLRPFVHSYSVAGKEHGGEGALYVLLRRKDV